MKTFAETKGKKTFNWLDFLKRAIDGKTSYSENQEAKDLSDDWVTCACGNQCDIIPRHNGRPEDHLLLRLCLGFSDRMDVDDYISALGFLTQIEERSKYLIELELEKRQNGNKNDNS